MNHKSLIINIIAKYIDRPDIQSDFKKVMKYCESQHRMFVTSIIGDECKPAQEAKAERIATVLATTITDALAPHDPEFDALLERHNPGTAEHSALLTLNGLLLKSVIPTAAGTTRIADQIKLHIAAHAQNEQLNRDMLRTQQLFYDAISAHLQTVMNAPTT